MDVFFGGVFEPINCNLHLFESIFQSFNADFLPVRQSLASAV